MIAELAHLSIPSNCNRMIDKNSFQQLVSREDDDMQYRDESEEEDYEAFREPYKGAEEAKRPETREGPRSYNKEAEHSKPTPQSNRAKATHKTSPPSQKGPK
jgi:hypothetical protein